MGEFFGRQAKTSKSALVISRGVAQADDAEHYGLVDSNRQGHTTRRHQPGSAVPPDTGRRGRATRLPSRSPVGQPVPATLGAGPQAGKQLPGGQTSGGTTAFHCSAARTPLAGSRYAARCRAGPGRAGRGAVAPSRVPLPGRLPVRPPRFEGGPQSPRSARHNTGIIRRCGITTEARSGPVC